MDKKKVIGLDVNTGSSEQDLNKLSKGFEKVNREAGQLDATFEDIYGDMKPLTGRMGELEDRLYELAQAGDTTSDEFKKLAEEIGRLRRIQQETDRTTDALAQTTSQKLGGSLRFAAGSMEATAGAMAALGIETEKGEVAIEALVGAMAVTDGIETMQESASSVKSLGAWIKKTTAFQKVATAAQWLWNAALNANPIGLIVAAVTSLIAAGYGLVKLFQYLTKDTEDYAAANAKTAEKLDKTSVELDKNREALKKNAEAVKDAQKHELDLARAKGATKDELRALERAQLASNIVTAENAVKTAESVKKDLEKALSLEKRILAERKLAGVEEEILEAQEEFVKKAEKNLAKGVEDVKNAIATKNQAHKDQIATTRRYEREDAQAQTDANNRALDKQREHSQKMADQKKAEADKEQERLAKQLEDTQTLIDEDTQLRLDKDKDKFELAKEKEAERNTEILDALKESLDNKKLKQEEYDALVEEQKANHLAKMTDIEANALINKNDRIAEILAEVPVEQKPLSELSPDELEEREEKELAAFDKDQEARIAELEAEGGKQEALTALKEGGEAARTNIQKKYSDQRKKTLDAEQQAHFDQMGAIGNMLTSFSNLAEKGSKEQKALAASGALINTYLGISKAVSKYAGNPAMLIPTIAAVSAAGFGAVKNIMSTKVDKNKTPSASGAGGGLNASAVKLSEFQQSNFDAVGVESQRADTEAIRVSQAQSDRPIQTYVTSGDVYNAQQLERGRVGVSGF